MIGKLKGLVDSIGDDWAIIDVGGVGYMVQATGHTLRALVPGEAATLYIDTYVREDVIRLYGFRSQEEKAWFHHLQSVQGVGARVALAILDVLTPGDLANAVALGDKATFARASGVGPKLAGRIASELKDKPAPTGGIVVAGPGAFAPSGTGQGTQRGSGLDDMVLRNDAISALVNLGYNQMRAAQAVMQAYSSFADDPPVDELIKVALKEIA